MHDYCFWSILTAPHRCENHMENKHAAIAAWKKRYLSHEECLNIQGFKGIKSYPRSHEDFYSAIGNAVNVEVVSKIAKNLFSKKNISKR